MRTVVNDLDPPYLKMARSRSRVRPKPLPRAALEGAESIPMCRHDRPDLGWCACSGLGVVRVKQRGVRGVGFLKLLLVQEVENECPQGIAKKGQTLCFSYSFSSGFRGPTCASSKSLYSVPKSKSKSFAFKCVETHDRQLIRP